MEKINVLVLPSDTSGVGKFRSVDPHVKLQNLYPNDFHVDIDYSPKINDDNYWKKYQIVHFHRTIGQDYDSCPALIEKLKGMGIVVVGSKIMKFENTKMTLEEYEELNANDKIFTYELTIANYSDIDDMDYQDRYKMEDFDEPFVIFKDVYKI